ncbi:MAG TPA: selenide, water dikinase SelD [Acidiferrobacterales bacterium]
MQNPDGLIRKDLVLLGGGHSHVAVLKRFGMRPEPGLRLTLITRDIDTPYSGMLPGYIAGHYRHDETHVDLRPLAQFAGARLYHTEAVGLDLANRLVLCRQRPPVPFDLLSIDIGSSPARSGIPGAEQYALPVKPIDRFLAGWADIEARALAATGPFRIVVVGGGAGGVELTLALQHRLKQRRAAGAGGGPEFHLVTDTAQILPTHNPLVRRKFARVLRRRGVQVHVGAGATAVTADSIRLADGNALPYDALIWVTQAAPAPWIADTGLATDAQGFIAVNEQLQSTSHPSVFAAGDIAHVLGHPRPKAGVMAVRAGPPLADNLRRAALALPLTRFVPQRRFLSLISTGDAYAVASRGAFYFAGRRLWRWKDWIDRRWMRQYQELPAMPGAAAATTGPPVAGAGDDAAIQAITSVAMRCGGCGAKVGSTVLSRVLARLLGAERPDVLVGLSDPDDAAVVVVPENKLMVHTVDFFRAFVDDAFLFGRIAANHALSDVYAMGAEAQSALALAVVPYGVEEKVEQQLYELLAGAQEELTAADAVLVGGHSSEGAELSFGLSVNGLVDRDKLMRKGGMQAGDVLILTKPLGTGTLFAADMRGLAKGRWIDGALAMMLQSNRVAADCLREHGAHALTDVTGFGLLGHLAEMIRASNVDAEIDLPALPVLDGAAETVARGVFSSLAPENLRLRRAIRNVDAAARHPNYPLLFDPQTSGGLLAALPRERAPACIQALNTLGYLEARIVGDIVPRGAQQESIQLRLG